MSKHRTFGDLAVEGLGEIASAIESGEPLTERRYVVRVDEAVLEKGAEVRKLRTGLGVSQGLFARFIGTSPVTVQKWEQGTRRVPRMAARFLGEIRRDLPYWKRRLGQSMDAK